MKNDSCSGDDHVAVNLVITNQVTSIRYGNLQRPCNFPLTPLTPNTYVASHLISLILGVTCYAHLRKQQQMPYIRLLKPEVCILENPYQGFRLPRLSLELTV